MALARATTAWGRYFLLVVTLMGCSGSPTPAPDVPTLVLPRAPQALDPRFVSDAYGLKISRLIFASLVTIDPDSLEAVPDLAQRIDVLSPTHYRVELRRGLRFSDGSALSTRDVEATFRSVVSDTIQSRYASTYRRIASMQARSARVIDFFLNEPHATFLTDLELPILRAQDEHAALRSHHPEELIGAGPYRLASRTGNRFEFEANPHWHHGEPAFAGLRMVVMRDENTRVLRLLGGKADVAINVVPPLLVPLIDQEPRFLVKTATGIGTAYLGLHTGRAALEDVRVRRAIAHAIDRASLVTSKLGGRAQLASGWIPPGHWAHTTAVRTYGYDPQQASALLDEAGLPVGPDGTRLRLRLRVGSDRFSQSIARAISSMLRQVGIVIEVRPTEVSTLLADLGRGRYDLVLLEFPELIEPHVLSWFFASDRIPGPNQEGANRWRFRNAALDAALERGRRHTDRTRRRQAYAVAQRILAEELPVIPLWHEDVVLIADERLGRLRPPRNGRFSTLAHQ